MNLANRPPLGQKVKLTKKDKARSAAIHAMPCCICEEYGMIQMSPTQEHHSIHGRYSAVKTPACMTIPLCEGHHQGDFDTSKIALHREPHLWRRMYGADHKWVKRVNARL